MVLLTHQASPLRSGGNFPGPLVLTTSPTTIGDNGLHRLCDSQSERQVFTCPPKEQKKKSITGVLCSPNTWNGTLRGGWRKSGSVGIADYVYFSFPLVNRGNIVIGFQFI